MSLSHFCNKGKQLASLPPPLLTFITVEELYDVGEIHAVRENDVAIVFQQRQRQEQHEVTGRHMLRRPNAFPDGKYVSVQQLALEVQQEPSVTEVEVRVVAVGMHQVVHLGIQDLNQRAHVSKVHVHGTSVGKVLDHPLHQATEAAVAQRLVVENHQQRRQQIAHALHVPDVQMFVHVTGKRSWLYFQLMKASKTYVVMTFRNLSKFSLAKYQ